MRALVFLALLTLLGPLAAQDIAAPTDDLVIEDQTVVTRPDIFGVPATFVSGHVLNAGSAAYTDIALTAEAYDEDDALIGEGFGYLVTTCGAGLLPSFALQPGRRQAFEVALEFYEEDADADAIARVELAALGTGVEAARVNPFLTYPDWTQIADDEVVAVEWFRPDAGDADEADSGWRLRYGVGCDADAFTFLNWYEYDPGSQEVAAVVHPGAASIDAAVLERLNLTDPTLYRASFLNFHPYDTRLIYQTPINTVLTAELDGTFQRIIWDELAPYSLHGLHWLPEGRFLAYYYGALGDPVRYFTASVAGQRISAPVAESVESFTVPGASPDGARVVISQTRDGVTGYYLTSTLNQTSTLLFEAEVPGNNWPAPVYVPTAGGEAFVYVIRPVDGRARLECYDTTSRTRSSLSVVPLTLTADDRGWSWMSPDNTLLAISANGTASGLWLADVREFSACRPLPDG